MFLPLVWAVWAVGHAAIWAAVRLAARGRRQAAKDQRWPPVLWVALAATGAGATLGLVQLTVSALLREAWPFRGELWLTTLGIWLAHGACFAALLLRRPRAGQACALVALGWAGLLAAQVIDHLARGRPVDPSEMALALAIIAVLMGLAWCLARSRRVRVFLRSNGISVP